MNMTGMRHTSDEECHARKGRDESHDSRQSKHLGQ
jgi:hypothetical protein